MVALRVRFGLSARTAAHFQSPSKKRCAILWAWSRNRSMRTFGGFKSGEKFFYGEVIGDTVQVLAKPYWIDIEPSGETRKLSEVNVDLPVAPSKLIAVG